MKKLLLVVGARPQFIKLATLYPALGQRFVTTLLHTGQHYDAQMSEVFFSEFELPPPDHHLGVGSASHGVQTGQMMMALDPILLSERPDAVVVFGDTNSTLAGALAAAKLNFPVVHVEAGLRSFARMPEELNRVVTDRVSKLLLAPSRVAQENLAREGITSGVYVVGDIMLDAARKALEGSRQDPQDYLVLTLHRAANTDNPERLTSILEAVVESGERVIFPCHPRTKPLLSAQQRLKGEQVEIIDPLGYREMLELVWNSRLVLTDSGGLQKEAYFLRRPCLTLRDETEWVETVENGWNLLVGAKKERVLDGITNFYPPEKRPPLYGDGHSTETIVQVLEEWLETRKHS